MKFFLQAEKTISCTFFITDFWFAETVLKIFFKKFFDFSNDIITNKDLS